MYAKQGTARFVRTALAWVLVLSSIVFLGHALTPELSLLRNSARDIQWWCVIAAILAAVPMFLFKACYHLILLDRLGGGGLHRAALAIYLQSQIVRYLPGKIWGLLYQSQRMATNHRPDVVVIANLWQMVITNILALGVVVSLLLGFHLSPVWLALLLLVVLGVEWIHRYPTIESWGLRVFRRVFPRLVPLAANRSLPPMRWKGTALLCAEWVFYFIAFAAFMHGKANWGEVFLIGAWYAGASLIALTAFVVPAGLAVREAIFVAVAAFGGADTASLVLIAALARIVFFSAELLAALLASLLYSGDVNEQC